jgi:hypothetical protein
MAGTMSIHAREAREEEMGKRSRSNTLDMMEIMSTMAAILETEEATAAVGKDGRGFILFGTKKAPTSYTPEGWLKTDGVVLVFDDIIAETGGAQPDRVNVNRPDLCPKMRRTRLSDYQ